MTAQQPGQLDLSFGNAGTIYENFEGSARAYDMAILPDDRILIVGVFESDFGQETRVARFCRKALSIPTSEREEV